MAESIDLLFTVADSSKSDILSTFQSLQNKINSDYAEIRYKVSPETKAEIDSLTRSLRDLGQVAGAQKGLGSAGNKMKQDAADVNKAFRDLMSLQKQISKAEIKLIDPKTTQADLNRLTEQIKGWKEKSEALTSKFGAKFSDEQTKALVAGAEDASKALETAKQRMVELQSTAAQKVKLSLELGTPENQITALENKFRKLGDIPSEIAPKFAQMRSLIQQAMTAGSDGEMTGYYKQFEQLLGAVSKSYTAAAQAARGFKQEASTALTSADIGAQADALMAKVNAAMQNSSNVTMLFRGKLKEIVAGLQECKAESDMSAASAGIRKWGNEFERVQKQISTTQRVLSTVGSKLSKTAKDILGISSGYMAVRKAVQTVKNMYKEVESIDTAMIGLYKVTDETSERYNKFLTETSRNAQALGTTISGLIDQTATWAKLGYSIDEAEGLAKISSIYAHVGEVDNETAVSDLVTSMKAFNIEASDAITIVDKLNILGKQYCPAA